MFEGSELHHCLYRQCMRFRDPEEFAFLVLRMGGKHAHLSLSLTRSIPNYSRCEGGEEDEKEEAKGTPEQYLKLHIRSVRVTSRARGCCKTHFHD
jgi:hypothetical protein